MSSNPGCCDLVCVENWGDEFLGYFVMPRYLPQSLYAVEHFEVDIKGG
jgi:hypothetical protein